MPMIRGSIAPQPPSAELHWNWRNRYGNEISPQADLQTNGDLFRITYSPSWAVESLKHSFQLEVHRVEPRAVVNWF
jgi:hypothetical protein